MTIFPESILAAKERSQSAKYLAAHNGHEILPSETPFNPRLIYFAPQSEHVMRQKPGLTGILPGVILVEATGSFADMPLAG